MKILHPNQLIEQRTKKRQFVVKLRYWALHCLFVFSVCNAQVIVAADNSINQELASAEVNKPEDLKPLRISMTLSYPPFTFVLPNGKPAGLYVDIWKEWSKVTGREIEFVFSGFAENMRQLKNGEADFHAGLFISESRQEWTVFSHAIDKIETSLFVSDVETEGLTLADFFGKRIGVGAGSFQATYLRQNYADTEVVEYVNSAKMINHLLTGKTDAIVFETPGMNANLSKMGIPGALSRSSIPIFSNTVHAMLPKRNQFLLPLINDGIRNLPIDIIMKLEQKWLPGEPAYFESLSRSSLATLTIAEQQWLSENKQFVLGIDENWKPFEYVDSGGKYSGISSEYVELVAEMLSIDLVPEFGNSWTAVIEKIKKGELDILPAIGLSEERTSYLSFSEPYIEFNNVVVAQKGSPILLNMAALKGKKIAAVRGYNIILILQRNFPDIQLILVENMDAGLDLVESGDVYGYIDNIAVVSHNININNRRNLEIAFHTPHKDKLTFGVRRGLEPLVPIINKVLAEITEKQRNEIVNRWLSVKVNVGTDILTMLKWGIPTFFVLAFVIAFVMRSNARMQKEIIRRRETEISLQEAKLAAEAAQNTAEKANQGKNQFLANISHEIRTPMNAIIGSAHLIEQTGVSEEQKNYLDILNLSANTLLALINDTLDWSKIEAGKIELENQAISLHDLVSDIIKQAEMSLAYTHESKEKRQLNISSTIDSKVPLSLIGDQLRLSQILLNLLSNAVKFTVKGSIGIELFIEYKKLDKLCMHFIVSDTGIGMTLRQTEKLFKTYSQADASTSRKYGGTGLGLSICKKLCQLMQGHIWVESKMGEGSQFHFTCMLGTVEDKIQAVQQVENSKANSFQTSFSKKDSEFKELLNNKKILIVDDNQINSSIAKKILANKGLASESAISGIEALHKIENSKYDCILMDIQMPEMDGYQVTQKIRQGSNSANIAIIGLSANNSKEDVNKGLAAGMNDYLGKPINPQELFKALARQFSRTNLE